MKRAKPSLWWNLVLVSVLVCLAFIAAPAVAAAEDTSEPPEDVTVRQGLSVENGNTYYYNEDGTLFTGGYKEVTVDGVTYYYFFQEDGTAFTGGYKAFTKNGTRAYYYFQEDGTAFTEGYLNFVVAEKPYYFYFQEDGSAFTGGYKEVTVDGKLCYFYFLSNGQGFNTGYKTAMIDGKKHYFYFGEDAQAVTETMMDIPLGERTAYMLFQENGRAFTNGYIESGSGESTDHYYFLSNGQAFTTGYKTVKIDGVTYFFYFEADGKAFTGGMKQVPFGTLSYSYYFQENGRAKTDAWVSTDAGTYYFQTNGRAVMDAFQTVDGALYHFDADGKRNGAGWFCVEDGYYYAGENCALLTDTVVEGYVLDAAGKSATKYRIIQYVNEHTDPTMTDQEKIDALYKWVLESDMRYISDYAHVSSSWVWKDSWVDDMAAEHMDKWGGNCFRYASFLGLLLREATGLPVEVHHGIIMGTYGKETPHGWAMIQQDGVWYIYDVELQKFTTYKEDKCYKIVKEDSTIHLESEGTKLY